MGFRVNVKLVNQSRLDGKLYFEKQKRVKDYKNFAHFTTNLITTINSKQTGDNQWRFKMSKRTRNVKENYTVAPRETNGIMLAKNKEK